MNTLAVPLDVRLMNLMASLLFAGCALSAVAAGAWWALRHPAFAIARIVVQGDLAHNNAVTLRANVAPQISGNFFTVNLRNVRSAFEQVPWVRSAQVRREYPRTLRVQLQEHRAVAHWGPESGSSMVNSEGEVFESNGVDAELDDLPRLLELSTRGGWRASFDGDAAIELGSGTPPEVVQRTRNFAETLTRVAAQFGRRADALESADLRHTGGYALRLRGVSTVAAQGTPRAARTHN